MHVASFGDLSPWHFSFPAINFPQGPSNAELSVVSFHTQPGAQTSRWEQCAQRTQLGRLEQGATQPTLAQRGVENTARVGLNPAFEF
jgi:hypothetical protein